MFLINGIRFWKGWTAFEAEGGLPERMLNLLRDEDIELWRLRREETTLSACCYARDYKRMHRIARRTGMRMHHTEKHGAPFYLHRYRARLGIPIGLILCAVLLGILSGRIWVIQVHGAEPPLAATIREVLQPMGVRVGASSSDLSPAEIQWEAIRTLPDITWLAVNMKGCVAEVYVLERKVGEPEQSKIRASNLVASRDGVIVRTEVREGQGIVKVGEGVTAGTLLVSGVVDTKIGPVLHRSEATILADTTHTLTVRIPQTQIVRTPTGERIRQTELAFFGLSIPLSARDPVVEEHHLAERFYPLTAGDTVLPLGLTRRIYTLLSPTEITYTASQAEQLAREVLHRQEQEELSGVTVRSREELLQWEEGVLVLTVTYACTENIAEERPLLVDP